jgi:hypothetical protein
MGLNLPLGHVFKGSIIEGRLPASCEQYLKSNQQTIVAMANFGLGLYEPTIKILQIIKPRLINGSILVFEDLNQATWSGETCALLEVFNLQCLKISRSLHCPQISWVTIVGGDE